MRVLFFKPHSRRAERIFSYVRNQVLGLVAFIIDRFLASVPNRYLVINLAELKKYYRLPQQVKDTSTSLIPYLDIGHHDRNVFINTLDNLFCMKVNGSEVNNMLLKLLVDYCLVAWGLSKVDEAIDITQEFAERELDRPEPVKRVMWDKSWVYAALAMLCPNQFHSNHLSIYTQYMRRCFKEVNQWRGEVANYAYLGYSDYVYTSVRVDQYAGAPLIRELLEWGFIRNEYQKILDILEEMGYLAGSKYWKVMLNSIEPVLELCQVIPNTFSGGSEIEKVKNKLIDILSAVYIRHPYDVELYLHKHDLPEAIQKQTRIRKAEERVAGDLLKGGLGAWGKFGLTQGFSNRGRPIMMWAFRSALTAKSLDQFISQASKGVVNLVTDQQVFPLDEDLTHLILNLHAS